MKILVTGTHLTPALATIDELRRYKGVDIVYVGRAMTLEGDQTISQESQIIPNLGVKFIPLIAGRLRRDLSIFTIISIFKIPVGFILAFNIILKERPDVILSFGGYVGVPMVFAGWLLSIPIIIHEQTLISGLATRFSRIFADKIAISFKNEKNKSAILTGNPIRKEILDPSEKFSPQYLKFFQYAKNNRLPTILVMGGNQGSHIINNSIEKILPSLLKIACVIHVTGDSKYKDYDRLKKLENGRYMVEKWLGEEYGAVLSKVDMVICRAGINTLMELNLLGKMAILIPIPYLYQDEQNKNAKYFQQFGMVKTLPQSQLTAVSLVREIKKMIKNLDRLSENAKEANKIIIPDAAKRLALETIILSKKYESSI